MFKTAKGQITIPVTAEILQDGGRVDKVRFKATYRVISSHAEKRRVLEGINAEEITDEALLGDYLVSWSDLKGDDGDEIPFTEENLAQALDLTEYRRALAHGFMRANFNIEGERAKN